MMKIEQEQQEPDIVNVADSLLDGYTQTQFTITQLQPLQDNNYIFAIITSKLFPLPTGKSFSYNTPQRTVTFNGVVSAILDEVIPLMDNCDKIADLSADISEIIKEYSKVDWTSNTDIHKKYPMFSMIYYMLKTW